MLDESSLFARLRSLLTSSPSRHHWRQICSLFSDWPEGEDKRIAVEYADTHLDHWPDRHKVMPAEWLPSFRKGEFHAHLLLPRTLSSQSIRGISVLQMEAAFDALAQTRIRRIEFAWTHLPPDILRRLAERESFANIEQLRLQSATIEPAWQHVAPFLSSPFTRNLRSLELSGFKLYLPALRLLTEKATLPSLNHLDLSWNNISGNDLSKLEDDSIPLFRHLKTLDLSWNPLGVKGASFLGAQHWEQLRGMRLVETGLGDRGLEALCTGDGFLEQLRFISLSNNRLTNAGLELLARTSLTTRLNSLDLSQNQVDEEGVRTLLALPFVQQLQELNLSYCPIGNEGATLLATTEKLPELQGLLLSHTKLESEGAQALFESPVLKHLRWLDLDNNPLDDKALQALANSETLRQLKTLCLGGFDVSKESLLALLSSPVLSKVQSLNLPRHWKKVFLEELQTRTDLQTPWCQHWGEAGEEETEED